MKGISFGVLTLVFSFFLLSNLSARTLSNIVDLTAEEDPIEAVKAYWSVKRRIDPRYVPRAARDGISGCVTLNYIINSDGNTDRIEIIQSFPEGLFSKNAKKALKKWRWEPTEENSNRTEVKSTIQLDFTLLTAADDHAFIENCGTRSIDVLRKKGVLK